MIRNGFLLGKKKEFCLIYGGTSRLSTQRCLYESVETVPSMGVTYHKGEGGGQPTNFPGCAKGFRVAIANALNQAAVN